MDKYSKHGFVTALVLEIRASLYSTFSDTIFTSKFSPFLKLTEPSSEVYFLHAIQHITELLSKTIRFVK